MYIRWSFFTRPTTTFCKISQKLEGILLYNVWQTCRGACVLLNERPLDRSNSWFSGTDTPKNRSSYSISPKFEEAACWLQSTKRAARQRESPDMTPIPIRCVDFEISTKVPKTTRRHIFHTVHPSGLKLVCGVIPSDTLSNGIPKWTEIKIDESTQWNQV